MLLLVLLFLLLFVCHPLLELFDGFALHGKLDVGVGSVNFRACRMAHERHANFLQDAGLHQASVEGMAKVVETDVADSCLFQCSLPRALDDADGLALVPDNDARGLLVVKQILEQPPGQRDLSRFSFRGLRTRDE